MGARRRVYDLWGPQLIRHRNAKETLGARPPQLSYTDPLLIPRQFYIEVNSIVGIPIMRSARLGGHNFTRVRRAAGLYVTDDSAPFALSEQYLVRESDYWKCSSTNAEILPVEGITWNQRPAVME
jgi:hypothetical protein